MIIHAIKTWFFDRVNSYNLGRKLYTSSFFPPFCREIIRVICAILAMAIEDLELRFVKAGQLVNY